MSAAYPVRLPERVVRQVVDRAAREAGIEAEALKAGRKFQFAHARQYAMWLLRQTHNAWGRPMYGTPQIGAAFGVRHSTVLRACKAVERRMASAA